MWRKWKNKILDLEYQRERLWWELSQMSERVHDLEEKMRELEKRSQG